MKKVLALLLSLCMLVSLAACADNKPAETTAETTVATEATTPTELLTDIKGDDPILKKTTASWLETCVLYEVNVRQFTEEGTFAAFENHLDRLKDMGVNTLWLMPIHPISETNRKGTLGSFYAVSDYREVNPEFGTMDDFKHLLNKAHEMGFKVIIDWVANHTGWDNAWIKEHEDWYVHDESGKIESPYDWTDTAQLDYENQEMRAEMIRCMQFWIEDIGVDGFRCDHAIGVPASFWNAAVYQLKSVNSEIMMLAETSAAKSLTEYAFDSCYNDKLYGQAVMTRGGVAINTIQEGMAVADNYLEGSFPMNYLDNHDKNAYEGTVVGHYGEGYPTLLALSFLTPGMPLLYTGNEEAYDHEIEFFEKDTVKWDENPKYAPLIKALSALKTGSPALCSTNRDLEILETGNAKIFAFSRTDGESKVVYIANLYKDKQEDVSASLGFDKATCVIHWDGEKLDTNETEMTAEDFASRDYAPYEFFVFTV